MKWIVGGSTVIGIQLAAVFALTAGAQQPRAAFRYRRPAERTAAPAASRPMPGRITLSLDRVTLREALHTIAKESGVSVSYSSDVVPASRRVSVHVRNATVGEALDSALAGTGVIARVWSATQIVLEAAEANAAPATPAHADAAGRVTDGSFRLTGVSVGPHRVTARRVGYAPVTRSVAFTADRAIIIDFALRATARSLDEVVVTGT